jgi:amino acid transporter
LQIAYGNLSSFFAGLVAVIIGVAMWLCGLASITSMSRMWYAFARDDGMPGAALLKRVDPRSRTPVAATVVTSALAILITIYAAAYSVVTSISTITLYLAYVIPIYLNWRNRRHARGEYTTPATAPWSLGRFAAFVNAIAIAWVIVIAIVFMLPPNELVLWTMVLVAIVLALYWKLSARASFVGPRRQTNA